MLNVFEPGCLGPDTERQKLLNFSASEHNFLIYWLLVKKSVRYLRLK